MKVSREQAAQNRVRIVETAGKLFRERGFDGVGVADIMQQAGLTHGGFYGHFDSKAALAAEAAGKPSRVRAEIWKPDVPADQRLGAFVRGYLAPEHRDDPANGCPMAALAADVAREPLPVRESFTAGVRTRINALIELIPGRNATARRRKALATIAGVVGALTMARAVSDPALSDEILQAAAAAFAA